MGALSGPQRRARYARTDVPSSSFRINYPDGFPSGFEPAAPPVGTWWWGTDAPFQPLTASQSLSAITAATGAIVNNITTQPWRLVGQSPDPNLGLIELPPPRWVQDPMLMRTDARYGLPSTVAALRLPQSAFWAQWLRASLLKGMGYLIFEEAFDGQPIAGSMRVLNPDYVTPTTENGYVGRRIGLGDVYALTDAEGRVSFGPRTYRLLELNNPSFDPDELGITPGVLQVHAAELGLAGQQVSYGAGTMRSGIPSGFLKVSAPTFTKAQADQLRADWMSHHGGSQRSVAVLNASVDFTPIALSPVDIALIEMRKMSLVDIANMFRVPVYILQGETGGLNYTNAESRSQDFRTYTLAPWAKAIEDVLSSLMPLNQYIEVDFRGLLKADITTRFAAYGMALDKGFFTIDEVRRLEGLPPLPKSIETARPPLNSGADDAPPAVGAGPPGTDDQPSPPVAEEVST